MATSFIHAVTTRFGIGVYHQDWFEHRFLLFKAFTLPSLMAQTKKKFIWFIRVDPNMPDKARRQLEEITSQYPNIVILELDPLSIDPIWGRRKPTAYIRENLLTNDVEHIITSRIDDDDAWHIDTVKNIHQIYENNKEKIKSFKDSRTKEASHRNLTNGLVLTFPLGYEWVLTAHQLREYFYPCHSMTVHMVCDHTQEDSCFSEQHHRMARYAKKNNFIYLELDRNVPMWLYLRHKQANTAHSKFVRSTLEPIQVSDGVLKMLRNSFGISLDDYQKYLASHTRFTGFNSELLQGKSFAQERREIKADITRLIKEIQVCNDINLREKMTDKLNALKTQYYENGKNIF